MMRPRRTRERRAAATLRDIVDLRSGGTLPLREEVILDRAERVARMELGRQ